MSTFTTSKPFTPDAATLLSLALVFSFLPVSQLLASYLLPSKTTSRKYYYLFLWCSFDVLTHTIVEGSYLYHCFFSYVTLPSSSDYPHPASQGSGMRSMIQAGPFLGYADRLYGATYSEGPMARLWQEYAKADRRWGGADPTVISLELLTVFGAGPLALYICSLITRIVNTPSNNLRKKHNLEAQLWFTAIVLSTAELYGGFITFAPEWLTNNTLLNEEGDQVYLWLYLVFFNMIWVFVPAWVLWEAWREIRRAFVRGGTETSQEQVKKVS